MRKAVPILPACSHDEKGWMEMKLRSFDDTLMVRLRDPEFAAGYLEDAYEDCIEEFLIALRKYIQANGGMTHCAEVTGLAREAIYRMLSEKGNPELRSVDTILRAFELRFGILGVQDTPNKASSGGLDSRSRDDSGEIRPKRADKQIGRLRRTYGTGLASGDPDGAAPGLVREETGKSLYRIVKGDGEK